MVKDQELNVCQYPIRCRLMQGLFYLLAKMCKYVCICASRAVSYVCVCIHVHLCMLLCKISNRQKHSKHLFSYHLVTASFERLCALLKSSASILLLTACKPPGQLKNV